MINKGDKVRFERLPPWVGTLPTKAQTVFNACLGGTFVVSEIDQNGLCVLDVSKLIDHMVGGFQNDIRLEEAYLRKQ